MNRRENDWNGNRVNGTQIPFNSRNQNRSRDDQGRYTSDEERFSGQSGGRGRNGQRRSSDRFMNDHDARVYSRNSNDEYYSNQGQPSESYAEQGWDDLEDQEFRSGSNRDEYSGNYGVNRQSRGTSNSPRGRGYADSDCDAEDESFGRGGDLERGYGKMWPGRAEDGSEIYGGYGRQRYSQAQYGGQYFGARSGGGRFAGVGPKNYSRSKDRIIEDVNQQLTDSDELDASEIDVTCEGGEIILRGTVDSRQAKRMAEDIAERISGVSDVKNELKVKKETTSSRGASNASRDTESSKSKGETSRVDSSQKHTHQ